MARRSARQTTRKLRVRRLLGLLPGLLIAAAAVAVTVQVSVAGEYRRTAPQVALAVHPYDAEARATLAAALAASDPLPEGRGAARELAFDAIRRTALNPLALRALGLASAADANSAQAQAKAVALFQEAERLSRRDQTTQLWLATYHLQRDELPEVLRHFDVALRTAPSGWDTLFPLLAAAAAEPKIADALIERMRGRPDWAVPFATYLLGAQVPPATSSYVIGATLDPSRPDEKEVISGLLQRFADAGEFDRAWQLYRRFGFARAAGDGLLNDGGFESRIAEPPFAWIFAQEPDLWAEPEQDPDGRGRVLSLFAGSDQAGALARQLARLTPGTYRIAARVGNVPQDEFQRPALSVTCAQGDKRVLLTIKPDSFGSRERVVRGNFAVPPGCGFQWLAISLADFGSQAGELPWIDDVTITRVGR